MIKIKYGAKMRPGRGWSPNLFSLPRLFLYQIGIFEMCRNGWLAVITDSFYPVAA